MKWNPYTNQYDSVAIDYHSYTNGRRTMTEHQVKAEVSWVGFDREIHEFDESGNEISTLYQVVINNQYVNDSKTLRYFSEGIDSMIIHTFQNDRMLPWRKYIWKRSSENKVMIDIFTMANDEWQPFCEDEYYAVTLDRPESMVRYLYSGSDLVPSLKCRWAYNPAGYVLSTQVHEWTNQQWQPINDIITLFNPGMEVVCMYGSSFTGYYRSSSSVKKPVPITPLRYTLLQNYPNPFNPVTKISYQVPSAGQVTLKVFDILGKEVATLVNNVKSPGTYEVQFDASKLPSGVYIYSLRVNGQVLNKKMNLIK
ncbi:MAG: T9SS type A sorting domain-containing protein [Ignavibacteria bacterium]|nr:T9SS type A sorting domain-containing protein [Ignavibacteria bacterium]